MDIYALGTLSSDGTEPFPAIVQNGNVLPLALILKGHGATIAGSDRSRDQGRTPETPETIASEEPRVNVVK